MQSGSAGQLQRREWIRHQPLERRSDAAADFALYLPIADGGFDPGYRGGALTRGIRIAWRQDDTKSSGYDRPTKVEER